VGVEKGGAFLLMYLISSLMDRQDKEIRVKGKKSKDLEVQTKMRTYNESAFVHRGTRKRKEIIKEKEILKSGCKGPDRAKKFLPRCRGPHQMGSSGNRRNSSKEPPRKTTHESTALKTRGDKWVDVVNTAMKKTPFRKVRKKTDRG